MLSLYVADRLCHSWIPVASVCSFNQVKKPKLDTYRQSVFFQLGKEATVGYL